MSKLSILLVLLGLFPTSNAVAESLKHYEWKNRLLIVHDRSPGQSSLKAQTRFFDAQNSENSERALLLLSKAEEHPEQQSDFYMLLIGYDGGVKAKFTHPTQMAEIYKIVDSMPMRQKGFR